MDDSSKTGCISGGPLCGPGLRSLGFHALLFLSWKIVMTVIFQKPWGPHVVYIKETLASFVPREPSVFVTSLQATFSLASSVTLFDLNDGIQKFVNSCRSSAEVCQLLGSQARVFRGKSCKVLGENPAHTSRPRPRETEGVLDSNPGKLIREPTFGMSVKQEDSVCMHLCGGVQVHTHTGTHTYVPSLRVLYAHSLEDAWSVTCSPFCFSCMV